MDFRAVAAVVKSIKEMDCLSSHFYPDYMLWYVSRCAEDARELGLVLNRSILTKTGESFYEKAGLYYFPGEKKYNEWEVSSGTLGKIYFELTGRLRSA